VKTFVNNKNEIIACFQLQTVDAPFCQELQEHAAASKIDP
jgi:hypothetical protein